MIDTQLKDRLMSALRDGVSRVNHGSDPDSALAKAASDANFNVEQTRRLCELFNTARTLHHFEKHADCKDAEFPLADSDVVLGIMFDEPEVADKLAEELYDYSEYERRDPARMEDEDDDLFGVRKVAEPLLDIEQQAARAYRIYDTQMSLAAQLRSEASQAESIATDAFAKLAMEVRYADDNGDVTRYGLLAHMRPAASERLSVHFDRPVEVPAVKVAKVVDASSISAWLREFDNAEDLMFKSASARTLADDVEKEAIEFREAFENIASGGLAKSANKEKDPTNKEKDPSQDFFGDLPEKPFSPGMSADNARVARTGAGLVGGATELAGHGAAGFGKLINPAAKRVTKPFGGYFDELLSSGIGSYADAREKENATSSAALANRQREMLITELLVTDPFISEADPDAVIAGYNTLTQLAPDLSRNKEVVRAILRQMAHSGALSTFDADSIVKLEKTMREITGKLKAQTA